MMARLSMMLIALALAWPAAAADDWDKIRSYTVEKKNEAVAYGRKLVRQTDRELRQLERKASRASGEAKVQFQSDLQELKAKRKQASHKLDEMGKATATAWDEAKNEFADAWKDLQGSYEKAVRKLK